MHNRGAKYRERKRRRVKGHRVYHLYRRFAELTDIKPYVGTTLEKLFPDQGLKTMTRQAAYELAADLAGMLGNARAHNGWNIDPKWESLYQASLVEARSYV